MLKNFKGKAYKRKEFSNNLKDNGDLYYLWPEHTPTLQIGLHTIDLGGVKYQPSLCYMSYLTLQRKKDISSTKYCTFFLANFVDCVVLVSPNDDLLWRQSRSKYLTAHCQAFNFRTLTLKLLPINLLVSSLSHISPPEPQWFSKSSSSTTSCGMSRLLPRQEEDF